MKKIKAIASKSDAHRALIAAALSENTCQVICNTTSADIEATRRCLDALKNGEKNMYCGESGSTLRFLLPVMGALGYEADFYPEGRLSERPLSPLYEEMEKLGCRLGTQGTIPFTVRGKLRAGEYIIPGNVSSQFISGLLFALPCIEGESHIKIPGKLESAGYVDMTIRTLSEFGIVIEKEKNGYLVTGKQSYRGPEEYVVEGDWSNSAFFLAAGAISGESVQLSGLSEKSVQGDKRITQVLRDFGAEVIVKEDKVIVDGGKLHGIKVSGEQIPDMIPAVSAIACGAMGDTVICGAGRLRIKESDRLKSITDVITCLGGEVKELDDGLIIRGRGRLNGGIVNSHGDHRIAMMAAVMSLICTDKVILEGSEAVNKSYPGFFKDMKEAGFDGNLERK